jgi:hypothetical protein
MPKYGQNDLEIWYSMYYGKFYYFPKICQNLPKNDDFLPKISDFLNFTAWFSVCNFRRKMHQILGKWSNWPNFVYECAFLGYLQQKLPNRFWIFGAWVILWRWCVPRGLFWLKLSKKAILAHIGLHKITKTLNIQSCLVTSVLSTLRNICILKMS